jgi:anti-sigma regulatory factor (Ser/Thr protein kinase)
MMPLAVAVADPSHVAAARFDAQRMARALEFDETRTGRVAIAVTEAVTNMLRHAGGGTLVAQPLERGGITGLEVIAIDRGPGMRDFTHSVTDGVSTAGSAGTGLGAMRRLSDEFDVYTGEREGTILRMAFWSGEVGTDRSPYEIGVVSVPRPGETVCGDAWGVVHDAAGATFLVADGLGHGPDAARAASAALDTLHRHPEATPLRLLDLAHGRLRSTRGAAIAVLRHDSRAEQVSFCGVGNISASVLGAEQHRSMVSHNGIVGHNVHKTEEYRYAWPRDALLVAHSDGLASHWDLAAFRGAARCHASVIAALLVREHSRGNDDVVALVVRRRGA